MKTKQLLQNYLRKYIYLFWDINRAKIDQLSDTAIIERTMQFGNMSNFKELEQIYTDQYILEIFNKIINKKRVNLRKETINFFNIYLHNYVS